MRRGRSVLGGQLKDVVARAVVAGLSRRDIISDAQGKVTDVKTAFSSWDNCMKASFCKWPVIAVIVVGGLILLVNMGPGAFRSFTLAQKPHLTRPTSPQAASR